MHTMGCMMVTKVQFGIVVTLLAAIALLQLSPVVAPARAKWEYRTDDIDDEKLHDQMNLFGAEGWELVFARRAVDHAGGKPAYEVIFKRRL